MKELKKQDLAYKRKGYYGDTGIFQGNRHIIIDEHGIIGIKMHFFKPGSYCVTDCRPQFTVNRRRRFIHDKKSCSIPKGNRHHREYLYILLTVAMILAGCGQEVTIESDRKGIDYEICQKEQLPRELQKLIEEKKKKACTFSFRDTKYTYLAVCYGAKKYAGYSIRVEECSKGSQVLYMRTQLIGPSAREPIVERKNWPWLVVRCEKTEDLCLIEP